MTTLIDIPGYEGKYAAAASGHIFSYNLGTFLSEYSVKDYKRIGFSLSIDGKTTRSVHRIICYVFHNDTYKPGLEAHHKDDNRSNNRPENLEWVERKENLSMRNLKNVMKPIRAEGLGSFESIKAAAIYLIENGIAKSNKISSVRVYLAKALSGEKATAYGYTWSYEESAQ